MNGGALGGGIVLLVAAALWVAYLIPSWSRRRDFLATERNAERLERTLRILAENAKEPEEVQLEAAARSVVEQQRLLRRQEQRAKVELRDFVRAAAAEGRAAEKAEAAAKRRSTRTHARARLVRSARAACTLILLVAVVTWLFSLGFAIAGGSWAVPIGSGVVGFGCVAALVALSGVSTQQRPAAAAAPRVVEHAPAKVAEIAAEAPVVVEAEERGWAPRSLPRPLVATAGSVAAGALDGASAYEQLKRIALQQERNRRATAAVAEEFGTIVTRMPVQRPVAPQPVAAPVSAPAADSRFARMGIVEPAEVSDDRIAQLVTARRRVG